MCRTATYLCNSAEIFVKLYVKHWARLLYIEGIIDCITGPNSSLFPAPIHFPMWLQSSFLWSGGELTLNKARQLVLARAMRQHGNFKAGPQKTLHVSTCLLHYPHHLQHYHHHWDMLTPACQPKEDEKHMEKRCPSQPQTWDKLKEKDSF